MSIAGEIEPNDTLATATSTGLYSVGSVSMEGCQIGNGSFPDRDVDLFSFGIDGPSVPVLATIEANAVDVLDAYVRLFNADGDELLNNDDRAFADADPRVRTYLLEPGTYYVGVSSWSNPRYDNTMAGSGRAGPAGLYALTITTETTTLPSSPFEPNDRASDATPMGGGSFVITGEFIGDGDHGRRDVDTYMLELAGAARIDVEVHAAGLGSPLDPTVRLRSCASAIEFPTWPDWCALGTNDDEPDGSVDSALSVGVPQGGQVYIVVSGAGNRRYDPAVAGSGENGSVGDYDLLVTVTLLDGGGADEPNDSILTATTVPIFVTDRPEVFTIAGVIGDGPYTLTRGDRDFYQVRVMDGIKLLTANVTPTAGSNLDPIIAWYDSDGRRMAVDDNGGGDRSASLTLPVGCMTVHDPEHETPTGYLLVLGTRQRFPSDPFVPWPDENRLEEFAAGDGPGSTGGYELTVSVATFAQTCGSEPNETLVTATSTGIVDEGVYYCVDGIIGDGPCDPVWLDSDMWSLEVLHAPALLDVEVFTCGFDALDCFGMSVFDPAGDLIAWQAVDPPFLDDASIQIVLNEPGTYVVALPGWIGFDPNVACLDTGGCSVGTYDISIKLTRSRLSPGRLGAPTHGSADQDVEPLLFATRLDDASNMIDVLDADTGAVTASFAAPERFGGSEGIAYSGSDLYFMGGGRYPKLYWLDIADGTVLDEYILWMGSGLYSDAVMLAGELFLLDPLRQSIHVMDPIARRFLRTLRIGPFGTITAPSAMAALAGPGRLYVAGAFSTGLIHEVDPRTGLVTRTLLPPTVRPTALAGIGDDRLYVADWQSSEVEVLDRDGMSVDALTLPAPAGSLAGEAGIGPFADFDRDGDVDLVDFGAFQRCFSGADGVPPAHCEAGDLNDDGRVDLLDYRAFPERSTGP